MSDLNLVIAWRRDWCLILRFSCFYIACNQHRYGLYMSSNIAASHIHGKPVITKTSEVCGIDLYTPVYNLAIQSRSRSISMFEGYTNSNLVMTRALWRSECISLHCEDISMVCQHNWSNQPSILRPTCAGRIKYILKIILPAAVFDSTGISPCSVSIYLGALSAHLNRGPVMVMNGRTLGH